VVRAQVAGPEIVLVTRGSLELRHAGEQLALRSGESAFIAASAHEYTLAGSATLFRARVNEP
jgi:mannose-6-phosphate isomerase class I